MVVILSPGLIGTKDLFQFPMELPGPFTAFRVTGVTVSSPARLRQRVARPAELSGKSRGSLVRPDGTVRDRNTLPRGYWEAKDTKDDLETETQKKIARGYPLSNIIFEDTATGVLFQNKQIINGPFNLASPQELAALLNQFFSYIEPDIEGFDEAIEEFKDRVPELARGLVERIQQAHKDNAPFQSAFEKFFDLCRAALHHLLCSYFSSTLPFILEGAHQDVQKGGGEV